ncbi:sulfite exporter TauE/SafE family protein [Sulfurimonas sp. HSL-1716]|uniref:sulfite exporter TauE/SafE family protein n=1 Tax=Hydrocurvibacter sulfurireducens TaxID=3131937 RepID=UPI0031F7B4F3
MFELGLLGTFVGLLSGFFGIGGGTILVPLLLFHGFDMKTSIGISVVQMVFSSVYGSYLNLKKGTLDVKMVFTIGAGGFIGALFSGMIVSNVSAIVLQSVFLGFTVFALLRLFFKVKEHKGHKTLNPAILFVIGFFLGMFSVSIGVGGSLLLVPILVGFLHVKLKNATSAGLFFVVFSSISGFISQSLHEVIDFHSGLIIGAASLVGVHFGVMLKHTASESLQRRLLILFYVGVVSYLTYRTFFK